MQVVQSKTKSELQSIVETHYSDLVDCGFMKTSARISEEDKVEIVHAITLHHVILRSKAEMDQFSEGLESCDVLAAIRSDPSLARDYFTIHGCPQLTAGKIIGNKSSKCTIQ